MSIPPPAVDTMAVVHDLVNPAAAVEGARRQLASRVEDLAALALVGFDPHTRTSLESTRAEACLAARDEDQIARMERERALHAWLVSRGIDASGGRAGDLVRVGVGADLLGRSLADTPEDSLSRAVRWLEAACASDGALRLLDIASRRITGQIKAIRSLARARSMDLHACLDNAAAMALHARASIAIERTFAHKMPPISGDEAELSRVWSNLLCNAAEAISGAGNIWIQTSIEPGFARVDIANDGPPIPHDVIDRIFERAFTTRREQGGSGLGLDICQQIVRAHGGDIRVSSTRERTSFSVRLPISGSEA